MTLVSYKYKKFVNIICGILSFGLFGIRARNLTSINKIERCKMSVKLSSVSTKLGTCISFILWKSLMNKGTMRREIRYFIVSFEQY